MVATYGNGVPTNWYDVTDYNVLTSNSGSTNVTNLGTLLTAAPNGATIYFPGGIYPMTGNVAVPAKSFTFQGQGNPNTYSGQATILQWTANVGGNLITLSAGLYWGTSFYNMQFGTLVSQASGYVVECNGNNYINFANCAFNGSTGSELLYSGIDFSYYTAVQADGYGGNLCTVYNCQFSNFAGTGIVVNASASSIVIDSCVINGKGGSAVAGINFIEGGATQVVDCDIIGCVNNVLINPTASSSAQPTTGLGIVSAVQFLNTYMDASTGSCVKITGAGATERCKFTACYMTCAAAASPANAVEISSTYAYTTTAGMGIDFVGCNILNTYGATSADGFNITGAADFMITNCNISGWTTGILVAATNAAGVCSPNINNSVIGPAGGYGANTTGLTINPGTNSYGPINVQGNKMTGNTTAYSQSGALVLATAGTAYFADNLGFLSTVYLTSSFAGTTGTGAQTVTGMSMVLPIGSYFITMDLPWTATGTVGSTHTHSVTYSAGTPTGSCSSLSASALIGGGGSNATAGTTAVPSATHSATEGSFKFSIYAVVAAAATMQLAVTNTTSADTVTVLAGSNMQVQKVL